ncbi:MAG: selenocysteine-specific translation elongation factor [Spirochaetae bacterium HGW-Spirochaetae-1]|jgi:selenocysteine-specific elongation factor|nr:MAG: selenocysteine-specific translation elongation factor [Spirochaetae bacterium HGW-Spirochaetae-1]
MYIVGTSGHIDHGKTSLIRALTGTDCDRLPEEKEREMTIDIGFASIDYPRFGTVSIIDVPGHERFIRNMVVGAWGIDLALLVVAVDDGWMPQTEDHFRVLQLLGVERLIAVLNKTDIADEEMISFVEEEVREKLEATRFAGSDVMKVSSKTGTGIEELREAIVVNLRKLTKASNASKPYLFIDRVFASKGYGTVITGTLKNGIFQEDETVQILPVKKEARIKRIESHYTALQEGNPSQRTALNLSGISVDEVKRGYVVVRDNFFTGSNDIIAGIQLLDTKKEIKNNLGIEVLIGTTAVKGKMILLDEVDSMEFPARIKLEEPWFTYPGQPFVMTSPGGHRIIGGGRVLLPEFHSRNQKKLVKGAVADFANWNRDRIVEFIFSVYQWMKRETAYALFPESRKSLDKVIQSLAEKGTIQVLNDYIVLTDYCNSSISLAVDVINKGVGLNLAEISHGASLNPEFARLIMPIILMNHTVIEKDGRYFAGDAITEDALSVGKKKILQQLLQEGAGGMELDKLKDDVVKKDVRDLVKLGFIVSLDGNILYHHQVYEDLKGKIMSLFDDREKIMVTDAKDATGGLSRKYIIPLLNRVENDGLIKRLGDFRIKV